MDNELEQKIISSFDKQEGIIALVIFGSFAKGTQTNQSDIDIAVLYDFAKIPGKWDLLNLRETLSEALGHDVDLICLNTANPIIAMQIHTTGKVILNRDHLALDQYFTTLFVQYIELKELRKPMEDNILERKIHD